MASRLPPRSRILDGIVPSGVSARRAFLRTAAEAARAKWVEYAARTLHATRRDYVAALRVGYRGDRVRVGLAEDAKLANLVEQGMGPGGIGTYGPYDVRRFLLRGSTQNVRRTRGGKLYLHVPFRRMTAQIKALGGAQAMQAAQQLTATLTAPNTTTAWGSRLPAGMAPNLRPAPTVLYPGSPWETVQHAHATDPLAGMVRMQKTYAKATQSFYMTWRTASEEGKPWVSKGVMPRWLQSLVMIHAPQYLQVAIDAWFGTGRGGSALPPATG